MQAVVALLVAVCSAGPAANPGLLTVGTYASSYNAHAINHAYAAPVVSSYVAAAPVAYSAPAIASAPLASAYSLHPYSQYSQYSYPAAYYLRR